MSSGNVSFLPPYLLDPLINCSTFEGFEFLRLGLGLGFSTSCHLNAIHITSWSSLYPSFIYVQVLEFVYDFVTKSLDQCKDVIAPV